MALLGNPNAGKSSLFNGLTGLHQKTGNYAGVTVDRSQGTATFSHQEIDYEVRVVDLPGIYSLYPKSADEWIRTLPEQREAAKVPCGRFKFA